MLYMAVATVIALAVSAAGRIYFPQYVGKAWFIWLESCIANYGIGFLVLYLVMRKIPKQRLFENRVSGGTFLQYFCMSMFCIFIGTMIGTYLNNIIFQVSGKTSSNELQTEIIMNSSYLVIILFVCVIAPIAEEYMMRKVLIDRVIVFGDATAILFSGLCFGLIHTNLSQFAYGFLAGCFFAYIYIRSGKIRYSIVLHMLVNFLGSVVPVFLERTFRINELVTEMQNGGGIPDLTQLTDSERLGVMIYSGYSSLLVTIYFIGLLLFFLRRRKIELRPGERTMRPGPTLRAMFGNSGMIGFLIVVVVVAVINAVLS